MESKLLSCPACGGAAHQPRISAPIVDYVVGCNSGRCTAHIPILGYGFHRHEAVKAWNEHPVRFDKTADHLHRETALTAALAKVA